MKRLLTFLLFLTIFGHSIAQNNHQVYTYAVTQGFVSSEYQLSLYDTFATWQQSSIPSVDSSVPTGSQPNISKAVLYKDYKHKNVFAGYNILDIRYLLKDSLKLMNWEVTNNTIEILGYSCQGATTSFRGRDYIAYFTTEIPISEGPWKFNGLPGMILKVEATAPDMNNHINVNISYSWECISIDTNVETDRTYFEKQKAYVRKLNNEETTSWKQMKKMVEKSVKKSKKAMRTTLKSSAGSGVEVTYSMENYPEIIHEELQTTGLSIKL